MTKDYPHDNIFKFYASYFVGEELFVRHGVRGGRIAH